MLGRKLETIATLATVAAMIASMTACGSGNTASNNANTSTQDKSEITMDDSTPSKLLESFAQAVKAEAWDEIPNLYSGSEKPKMAGKAFRDALIEPAKVSVGESYNDDDDIVVPVTINGEEFFPEVVKSPEGGWRLDTETDDGIIGDADAESEDLCVAQLATDGADGYLLPGQYELSCKTSWGLEGKETRNIVTGYEQDTMSYKWPDRDTLVQQVKNAFSEVGNDGLYVDMYYDQSGCDSVELNVNPNVEVLDMAYFEGSYGSYKYIKLAANIVYDFDTTDGDDFVDDGTGTWFAFRVKPEGITFKNRGNYETSAYNPAAIDFEMTTIE